LSEFKDGISIIEYEIKNWIIEFLKETRDEWIPLIKTEKKNIRKKSKNC
jgi:hypothetical protein